MAEKSRRLDPIELMEAVETLNEHFLRRPAVFERAFDTAKRTSATNLDGAATNVAVEWTRDHAASFKDHPELAKLAANLVLNDAPFLKSLGSKVRHHLFETLFPFFELTAGWREVAEKAGFTRHHIGFAITQRVRAITSRQAAQNELAFIRQLLAVPNDQKLRYQNCFTRRQLQEIAAVFRRYAREEMDRVKDPRSMWRHGL